MVLMFQDYSKSVVITIFIHFPLLAISSDIAKEPEPLWSSLSR